MNPYSEQPSNYGQVPYPPPPYPVGPDYYQPYQRPRPEFWRVVGTVVLVGFVVSIVVHHFFFPLLLLGGLFFFIKRREMRKMGYGRGYSRRHRFDAESYYYPTVPPVGYYPSQPTQSQPYTWPTPTDSTGSDQKY